MHFISGVVDVSKESKGLQIYYGCFLNSHGAARSGYDLRRDTAEMEWTKETHASLRVRHRNYRIAKMVKGMIIEKYPNRTALIASITEGRDQYGNILLFENGVARLPKGVTELKGEYVELLGYELPLPPSLTKAGKLMDLDQYAFPLPEGLQHLETRPRFIKRNA